MIELEPAMTYRLDVRGPLEASDGSPASERRQYWEMARATLEGADIHAVSALPGIDWFTPLPAGYGRPHVRLAFHTDDGALVLLEYHGVVHATDTFTDAVERDVPTTWDTQYMRMALTFDNDLTALRVADREPVSRARQAAGSQVDRVRRLSRALARPVSQAGTSTSRSLKRSSRPGNVGCQAGSMRR